VAEMIQKHIAMASSAPWERVAGLVDVIDETEELCYIDDDAPSEAKEQERSALETREGQKESAMGPSESSGLKPQDPIDLDPSETERPTGDESRSPPPGCRMISRTDCESCQRKRGPAYPGNQRSSA
jgi:hypothetical protein